MEQRADRPMTTARKRSRRRSHTRKSPLSSPFINMAEARREIVNALHLHRSSSAAASAVHNPEVLTSQNYYRQLTDSMPIPKPTWSTTAPAVLSCAPVPPVEVNLEVEWIDYYNLLASHSWWIEFLNSLDGKKANQLRDDGEGLGTCLDDSMNIEKSAFSPSDGDDQSMFMDDWLIFPECGEQL